MIFVVLRRRCAFLILLSCVYGMLEIFFGNKHPMHALTKNVITLCRVAYKSGLAQVYLQVHTRYLLRVPTRAPMSAVGWIEINNNTVSTCDKSGLLKNECGGGGTVLTDSPNRYSFSFRRFPLMRRPAKTFSPTSEPYFVIIFTARTARPSFLRKSTHASSAS